MRKSIVIMVVVLCLSGLYGNHARAVMQNQRYEVETAIGEAERELGSAYVVVRDIFQPGTGIPESANALVIRELLNYSAAYLAKAAIAFREGDYQGSIHYVGLSEDYLTDATSIMEKLSIEAEIAEIDKKYALTVNVGIGVFGVVILALSGWIFIDNRSRSHRLSLKQEVLD